MAVACKTVADRIRHLGPCPEALEWTAEYMDPAQAWRDCQRGDWMLWLLGTEAGPPESEGRKALVLCACDCAELSLMYTKDARVSACIDVARRWARGQATIDELRQARSSAAAAYAASAAAVAAAAAAAGVGAAAARINVLAQCAEIVRRHYPKPPLIANPERGSSRGMPPHWPAAGRTQ